MAAATAEDTPMNGFSTNVKAREARLRRAANRRGLQLSKSRYLGHGYELHRIKTGEKVVGNVSVGDGRSLDEIERYLFPATPLSSDPNLSG